MLSKATYATLDGKRVAHVESWTLDVVRFRRVPDGELLRCSMSAFKARYGLIPATAHKAAPPLRSPQATS